MTDLGSLLAAVALASTPTPNPEVNALVAAFGPLKAVEVEVIAQDGVIPSYNDTEALAYIERRFTQAERADFSALIGDRPLDRATAGERFAEHLTAANILSRSANVPLGRRVALQVRLTSSDFPVMRLPLVPVTPIRMSKVSATIDVIDAESRSRLAAVQINDVYGLVPDSDEAGRLHGLRYQNFGRDDHLQVLAGLTNALARSVEVVLEAPELTRGLVEADRFTVGTGIQAVVVNSAPAPKVTIQLDD